MTEANRGSIITQDILAYVYFNGDGRAIKGPDGLSLTQLRMLFSSKSSQPLIRGRGRFVYKSETPNVLMPDTRQIVTRVTYNIESTTNR